MEQAPLNVELILRGRLARRPVIFAGQFTDGRLAELAGGVTLGVKLADVVRDLGEGHEEAGRVLQALVGDGDIDIDSLGGAWRRGGPDAADGARGSVQIGLVVRVGSGTAQFLVVRGLGKQKGFLVGIDLRVPGKVPGNFLAGLVGDITIDRLGVFYGSEEFPKLTLLDPEAFPVGGKPAWPVLPPPPRSFPRGLKAAASLRIGGVDLFGPPPAKEPPGAGEAAGTGNEGKEPGSGPGPGENPAVVRDSPARALSRGSIHWAELNKAIGPLTLRRVGLSYEAPRVGIRLDAGLRLGVLNLAFDGLGLSYPINEFRSRPGEIWERLRFHLDGASVSFANGPLTIGGGLIRVIDPEFPDRLQLDGQLLIRTSLFTVNALGSYADLNGTPSFFVFAALQKELGGPPFFFVTGLAVGMGIHRVLRLPDIREVQNFPLIRAATDPAYLAGNPDLPAISRRLDEYVAPMPGNFWVAAGVRFTSFGQVESFAMVSVAFGTQLEIALLGISRLRVPKLPAGAAGDSTPAVAQAEMAFKVALLPSSGLLSLEARLTENSYVLRPDFRLRGGFAFYSWFAGPHAGDFVISIGGYHPRYQPPAHYPRPDRVEFECRIGQYVTISGHCYFALCPSAIMAGGGLSIVYQRGGIRAWFIAQADFLVQWKPLHYDLAIGVSIGVALRLNLWLFHVNLSVELSASVQLHGPPLGGLARVSLYIVTIEIAFGEPDRLPPPLMWESSDPERSFTRAFLPEAQVTALSITGGLIAEAGDGKSGALLPVVAPQKLVLSARTLVPATALRFNHGPPRNAEGEPLVVPSPRIDGRSARLGVRPMAAPSFHSLAEVLLTFGDDDSPDAVAALNEHLECALMTGSVPLALWGQPTSPADRRVPPSAGDQLADDVTVGLEIRTRAGPRPWETPVLELEVLAYERHRRRFDWLMPKAADALSGYGDKTLERTVTAPEVRALRGEIVARLAATGRRVMASEAIRLDGLAAGAPWMFQDMPAMARVGQYPPRTYPGT